MGSIFVAYVVIPVNFHQSHAVANTAAAGVTILKVESAAAGSTADSRV